MRTATATAAAALALLSGCATIFTGTSDTLTFAANVPGVRLSIDGRHVGELPLTVPMSRNFMGGQRFLARFERAGYQTQEFTLQREFNAVAILDVTSIPTSGGIDVLTGALMKFSPREYHVQMLREGGSTRSTEYRRGAALWRFVLANHRAVQTDVARGGGEYLSGLAALLCGDDAAAARGVEEEALRRAPLLLAAQGPHELVARLDALLAARPELAAHRI